jgi:hypothetical protein
LLASARSSPSPSSGGGASGGATLAAGHATTLVPFGILALTTGAFRLWGGTAPPRRELVAAVLLAVFAAWAWQSSEDARVQRASLNGSSGGSR